MAVVRAAERVAARIASMVAAGLRVRATAVGMGAAAARMIGVTARVVAIVNLMAVATLMAARLLTQPVAGIDVQLKLQLMRLVAARNAAQVLRHVAAWKRVIPL